MCSAVAENGLEFRTTTRDNAIATTARRTRKTNLRRAQFLSADAETALALGGKEGGTGMCACVLRPVEIPGALNETGKKNGKKNYNAAARA